jgi:hypothetical protein
MGEAEMDFVIIVFSLVFGFIFVVSQLFPDFRFKTPILGKTFKGVICDIDKESQIITIEYEKYGRKHRIRHDPRFSNSAIKIEFKWPIGTEVSFTLSEKDEISYLAIYNKPESSFGTENRKHKISWGLLLLGVLMLGYGLYRTISFITTIR